MTTIPLERIAAEARNLQIRRMLLTLIASVFFAVGWVPARLWLGFLWCCAAVKVGWQEGLRKPPSKA